MLYFLIAILIVSQIIGFIKIKELKSTKEVPKGSIILKPIPSNIKYSDVDTDMKFLDDIFESIKLENWTLNITPSHGSTKCWDMEFISSSNVVFKSRIRLYSSDERPYLGWCTIIDVNGAISIDENDLLSNKVIPFLWDYLVKYHEDINSVDFKILNNKIKNISTKLKTLNRDRKLNTIFK